MKSEKNKIICEWVGRQSGIFNGPKEYLEALNEIREEGLSRLKKENIKEKIMKLIGLSGEKE